jgi:hypothetical protein
MLRLNQRQRELLAEKVGDMGNLIAGALLIGQFLADSFSVVLAVAGFVLWVGLFGCALTLLDGG